MYQEEAFVLTVIPKGVSEPAFSSAGELALRDLVPINRFRQSGSVPAETLTSTL